MRVSYEWLGDFVDLTEITPEHAAEVLTMAGLEVSEVRRADLGAIVVGRVVSQTPHPRSQKPLWIHQVDLGDRTEQVIAGAPNAVPGSLVPVALPGTTVPSGKQVRDAVIAGVAGRGMLCSEAELELGDDGGGIMLLEQGRPGQSLADLYPVDAVLEVEVTSNRPDCLAHFGVARELAAALARPLRRDFMPPFTGGIDPPGRELIRVTVEAADLCRRYIGAVVSEVQVGESPGWMKRRLRAAGVRPINNVVDVTNYVLLEYGQPLHAFDFDRLEGAEIRVRRAREGEELRCLDGVTRQLEPEMLVLADGRRPVGLAGVIGGEESAVNAGTSRVLLEAATFNGPSVRNTAHRFGLRTEASGRFEKGLPPELALAGARRAATLLQELARGRVHRDWADEYPVPQPPIRVAMDPARIDALLGIHVPLEEAEAILVRLGFHVRVEPDGSWDVLPPVFRLDVAIPEDVVEEVGRIHGYEKVPARLPAPSERSRWEPYPVGPGRDELRQVLVGAGFSEVVTAALVGAGRFQHLQLGDRLLRIQNPLSEELDAVRTALLPQLLDVVALNVSRGVAAPAVFELGRVYLARAEGQPEERDRLAALAVVGADAAAGRGGFLRLKAILGRLAEEVSAPGLAYEPAAPPLFHPGRCAQVSVAGRGLGHVGELHPLVAREADLPGRAVAFEIDAGALLAAASPRRAVPLPRFPAVERDLSLVVGEVVPAGRLLATIKAAGGELLESAVAFDEFRGSQLGEGLKSVAFALTFRSPDRTLTDREVEPALASIRQALEREHGARVRGSEA